MSKAVLVLEMPENCDKCILHDYEDNDRVGCTATGFIIHLKPGQKKPDWCPLRPLPEEKKYGKKDFYAYGCVNGWNDCLRAIEGSGEDETSDREK